ncbi:MAG: Blp family class II bacteriocin [Oscillospiraceae bacterium]|nr:Blp family class II bacteriocin [Oscillospiraceae bacterium]
MNTNTMELNLNEMELVTGGGDTLDHVAGAVTGVVSGAMVGCVVGGTVGGAVGAVVGSAAGAIGCGVTFGIYGIKKVKSWFKW